MWKVLVVVLSIPCVLWGKKAVEKTGRHIRPGEHDINSYDWERYLSFADKWLK